MTEIEKSLTGLKDAFAAAAAAIQKEQPDIWAKTVDIYQSEEEAVRFLVQPHMDLAGEIPAEYAQRSEQGRQDVLALLSRLEFGAYT